MPVYIVKFILIKYRGLILVVSLASNINIVNIAMIFMCLLFAQ